MSVVKLLELRLPAATVAPPLLGLGVVEQGKLHVLGLGVGLGDARALVFEEAADRLGLGVADCGEVA